MSRRLAACATLACLCGASLPAAAGTLSLRFIQPAHYTDAIYSASLTEDRARETVQRELGRHLEQLAGRLPPDTTLEVEVTDIDLAGRIDPLPWRGGTEVRVVRPVDWPRMAMRYTLRQGERILVRNNDEKLADMNFQSSATRYSNGDPLRYEKAMLDDWFDRRIVRRVAAAG